MSNEKTLSEKISEYLEAKSDFEVLNKTELPVQPILKKAYTVNEYNSYSLQMNDWRANVNVLKVRLENAEKKYKELREFFLDYLPTSHVWFLSEDKAYAIAIQRSDWPMDPPKILVEKNPDIDKLPQLQLQRVNCN